MRGCHKFLNINVLIQYILFNILELSCINFLVPDICPTYLIMLRDERSKCIIFLLLSVVIVHMTVLFKLNASIASCGFVFDFQSHSKQSFLFCSPPKLIQSFRKVFVKTLKDLYGFDLFQELKLSLTTLFCPSVKMWT